MVYFMIYREIEGGVEITEVFDFDLAAIFKCGQCFRWVEDESGVYCGVAFGRVVKVRLCGETVFITCSIEEFEAVWRDYFDLDSDYSKIRERICIDDYMRRATDFGAGIRILRQDKWEALCSFIISQNNNIPRIKKIIDMLCRKFGEQIDFDGGVYFAFPSAERLAMLNEEDLEPLRCGYRSEYILNAAKAVASGVLDLDALSRQPPDFARAELKKLHGIGNKVADCVLLFGLHMLDLFPMDVWMKRTVLEQYGPGFDPSVFKPYAGIAQQYIFHYARNC